MAKSENEKGEILNDISNVTTDVEQLDKLAHVINGISETNESLFLVEPMLRIFERFPESDGFGIFWSILHKIEGIPGYEPYLLASVKRKPTDFSITMINRIINDGQNSIEGKNLLCLLAEIEADTHYSENIRNVAREYLEYKGKSV